MTGEKFQSPLGVEGEGGSRDHAPKVRNNYLYHIISSHPWLFETNDRTCQVSTLGLQIE